MRKQYGGLGVPDLKDLNLCLLGSWVKRYFRDEGKLWKKVVDQKYCRRGNIFCSDRSLAPPFWKCVILAAQAVKMGYMWSVGKGKGDKVRFWEDTWVGTAPLAVQFWELYCICNEKTKVVSEVLGEGEIRLSFRRTFSENMMQTWCELL
jgi:hypothetical protein